VSAFYQLRKSNINKVVVNYVWTDEDAKKLNFHENEYEHALFLQFFPPSEIRLSQNVSVNLLKALYVECYINPNFVKATINYS
jgi:hypothetical protein